MSLTIEHFNVKTKCVPLGKMDDLLPNILMGSVAGVAAATRVGSIELIYL